jgi:hypothetical protein
MLLNCTTKGCLQQTEAKLNRDTGEVICDDCGTPIANITSFTKKALNSVGQVLRSQAKKAFQALCNQCKTHKELYIEEGKAYCKSCAAHVPISAAFLKGLKLHLEGQEKG